MAEATFQNIKSPLSRIFHRAIDSEIIEPNPLSGLTFSKERSIDIKPLTEENAFMFLDAAKGYKDGKFYPHFLTLLRTGLRVGEMVSLKWKDMDFNKRQILVQRHIVNGVVFPNTKNGKTRIVDMSLHLSETLKSYKREKQKQALKDGSPFSDWMFNSANRDKPIWPMTVRNNLEKVLSFTDLSRIRVHDLRHSYATIRLLKGHDIGDVSYQMGHSSIQITFDTYTHWIPGKFKSQIDDLDMHPNAPLMHPKRIENLK